MIMKFYDKQFLSFPMNSLSHFTGLDQSLSLQSYHLVIVQVVHRRRNHHHTEHNLILLAANHNHPLSRHHRHHHHRHHHHHCHHHRHHHFHHPHHCHHRQHHHHYFYFVTKITMFMFSRFTDTPQTCGGRGGVFCGTP